jgi:uncharacterized protein (TIGR03118 family)
VIVPNHAGGHGGESTADLGSGVVVLIWTEAVLAAIRPWGLEIAPPSFGKFAGDLLVGNFGDGRITAVDRRSGHVDGQLRDRRGKTIVIDGLWALLRGTATTGGTDAVWFSAGPDDEANGLIGQIRPAR